MQGMNISIPDPLKAFVDRQIASGRYGSVSEYIRELIREDEKRKAQLQWEGMLLEGHNTPTKEMTRKEWGLLKKEVRDQLAKRKSR